MTAIRLTKATLETLIFVLSLFLSMLILLTPSPLHAQVSTNLFMAGFNKQNSPWCPVDGNSVNAKIYGYRIWDDTAKLSHIYPSNSTPNWTNMDNMINSRALSGGCPGTPMKIIYTFGGMPAWLSACSGCADPSTSLPGPTGSGFGGGTQCSGPTDYGCLPPKNLNTDGTGTLSEYQQVINDIVTRYSGKITYYEIWNEADSPNFWCVTGSPVICGGGNSQTTANTVALKRLVRMGWVLKKIVGCVDPSAKILSPSMHVGTALTWFHNFNITSISAPAGVSGVDGVPVGCNWNAQTVTGKDTYDYVNIHARGTSAAAPNSAGNWRPEAIINAYNNIVTEIANDTLPNPTVIFNNEFGFNSSTEGGSNADGYSSYIARSYILCASLNFAQCYWYQWDTTTLGPSQNAWGTAYDTVAGWLINATFGATCTSVTSIWTCTITNGGVTSLLAWDESKTCNPSCTTAAYAAGAAYTTYQDVTGATNPTSGGNGTVQLGVKPLRLIQQATAPAAPTQVQGKIIAKGKVKLF